jgi:2Fe-2S ferredoxin
LWSGILRIAVFRSSENFSGHVLGWGVPRVTFLPSGRSYDVTYGGTLLRAAIRARVPIARSCRGVGVCAACRVRVVDGAEHLAPMGALERVLTEREPLRAGERYACLAHVLGNVSITTTYW